MPDSNFLLLVVWLGSKFEFLVANLQLATPNFKPCNYCATSLNINTSDISLYAKESPLNLAGSDQSCLKQMYNFELKGSGSVKSSNITGIYILRNHLCQSL